MARSRSDNLKGSAFEMYAVLGSTEVTSPKKADVVRGRDGLAHAAPHRTQSRLSMEWIIIGIEVSYRSACTVIQRIDVDALLAAVPHMARRPAALVTGAEYAIKIAYEVKQVPLLPPCEQFLHPGSHQAIGNNAKYIKSIIKGTNLR